MKNILLSVCCVFALLILGGCSSNEVKGVCKSCKPYYVRGEWHYPQKHYDYDEIGLASWYGPGFHGKPKPHGELYDQFEMTAAHKTLPIPTIALVTNLDTGARTKVLIDDRGPFVYEGRIIDLSVAAAKALGVYNKGTAHVRVTALPEESDRFSRHLAQYRKAKCPKGRRWVQIFQDDLATEANDLRSDHYRETPRLQKLVQKEDVHEKVQIKPETLAYKTERNKLIESSIINKKNEKNLEQIINSSPFNVHKPFKKTYTTVSAKNSKKKPKIIKVAHKKRKK
jgi:rare lipoprotein A